MGRPTARGPAPPPAPPPDQPPPDQPPPPPEDEIVTFLYQGEAYRIPQSVYNQIQGIYRDYPDPFQQLDLIGRLLQPYGYVPPPPPDPLVQFQFQNVVYMIPQLVYDAIQEIYRTTPDVFEQIRLINILLVPYGAPPVR